VAKFEGFWSGTIPAVELIDANSNELLGLLSINKPAVAFCSQYNFPDAEYDIIFTSTYTLLTTNVLVIHENHYNMCYYHVTNGETATRVWQGEIWNVSAGRRGDGSSFCCLRSDEGK
jgi:hypothetical protein